MPRYIDSEKIEIRVPYGIDNDGEVLVPIAAVRQSIAQTPTEDVAKVVHGYWKNYGAFCVCSVCEESNLRTKPYCPNCGAKMDGERKEQS